jgi:hypothetical protein
VLRNKTNIRRKLGNAVTLNFSSSLCYQRDIVVKKALPLATAMLSHSYAQNKRQATLLAPKKERDILIVWLHTRAWFKNATNRKKAYWSIAARHAFCQ